jgi:protein tyrosine phosphatase (PTP) superfamily phosphohydrolase (DUF442 family)
LLKGIGIVGARLYKQGLRITALWAVDHLVRGVTGAPLRAVSQITPQIHVGGQYRRRGWPRLAARGVTAVINMRVEFDDRAAGIAPPRYLHLPTVDDHAPEMELLQAGVAFMADEIARGGAVYVHCKSGVGRAATMAVAYFVAQGLSLEQAGARILQVRPFVRPTSVQVEQLERFAAQFNSTTRGTSDRHGI